MRTTQNDERIIGAHMMALATMFEGQAVANPGIRYQAVLGWDEQQVGELCRLIDAADADGVLAFFDPKAIERGPAHVGKDERAALVARDGRSYLTVENGRFAERRGKPVKDLGRGKDRFRRRLSNLV